MARNIFAILDELSAGIQELKQTLAPLSALAGTAGGTGRTAPAKRRRRAKARPPKAVASRPTKTPPTKAPSRKGTRTSKKRTPGQVLHTQYMNALKSLGVGDQARVKKLRAADGPEAAVKLATSLAK